MSGNDYYIIIPLITFVILITFFTMLFFLKALRKIDLGELKEAFLYKSNKKELTDKEIDILFDKYIGYGGIFIKFIKKLLKIVFGIIFLLILVGLLVYYTVPTLLIIIIIILLYK